MIKPDSLRAAFTAIFPELATNPDRLRIWVEEGCVRCHRADPAVAENLSFTIEYPLIVAIDNWERPSVLAWIVLIDWLATHQPDLLTPAKSKDAIQFEADNLSTREVFLSFEIPLTEYVRAMRKEDGGFDLLTHPEPDPMVPDAARMVPDGELLKTIFLDGVQIVPDPLDA